MEEHNDYAIDFIEALKVIKVGGSKSEYISGISEILVRY